LGFTVYSDLVLYAAYGFIGLAVFLVARMLFQEEEARAAQDTLDNEGSRSPSKGLIRITRPFFSQYIVPMVRGKEIWENRRTLYRRKLISAGLRDELTPDEFIAFKFGLILFFPLVGGLLQAMDMIDVGWIAILLSGVLGFFYPDLWISSLIKERHHRVLLSMPFVVDLLALSTEAGLDFVGAIQRVVEKAKPSPLIDELSQLLKEIQVGSSRADALREFSMRVNMPEVNSFVSILISADQMGAPIGKILRQQSEQIRIERMLRAEKAGAAAAGKLLFPLVFFMLPAFFILIFAPMYLSMRGGG
jgi:tight adherence protein C